MTTTPPTTVREHRLAQRREESQQAAAHPVHELQMRAVVPQLEVRTVAISDPHHDRLSGTYEGQVDPTTGKRHGQGSMKWSHDGATYQGGWIHDKMHGTGILTSPDGRCYEGQFNQVDSTAPPFKNRHGQGSMIYNGRTYKGQWEQGQYHGFGVLTWSDGRRYEGQFRAGRFHGQGVLSWPDGQVYRGEFNHFRIRHVKDRFEQEDAAWFANAKRHANHDPNVPLEIRTIKKEGTIYHGQVNSVTKEKQGRGVMKWLQTGLTYDGEWVANQIHGSGVLSWTDGRRYQGSVQSGHLHGQGVLTWPAGQQYSGEFKSFSPHLVEATFRQESVAFFTKTVGRPQVHGTNTHSRSPSPSKAPAAAALQPIAPSSKSTTEPAGFQTVSESVNQTTSRTVNEKSTSVLSTAPLALAPIVTEMRHAVTLQGDKYHGEVDVATGQWHGLGKLVYASSGDVFEGQWLSGKRHGKGKVVNAAGAIVYEGDYQNHLRHGFGVANHSSGDKYEGEFQDGRPHGIGKMVYASSGDVFEGQWLSGKRHGKGKVVNAAGAIVYEGNYQNHMRHGFGVANYPSGDKYEGEFQDGRPHGKGVLIQPDGRCYEGTFEVDCKVGVLRLPNGEHYKGLFWSGKPHGRGGQYTWPAGAKYVGDFVRGVKQGQGKMVYPDKSSYSGAFFADKPHGRGVYTDVNGRSRPVTLKEGIHVPDTSPADTPDRDKKRVA